jgi:hypothetical protein
MFAKSVPTVAIDADKRKRDTIVPVPQSARDRQFAD